MNRIQQIVNVYAFASSNPENFKLICKTEIFDKYMFPEQRENIGYFNHRVSPEHPDYFELRAIDCLVDFYYGDITKFESRIFKHKKRIRNRIRAYNAHIIQQRLQC